MTAANAGVNACPSGVSEAELGRADGDPTPGMLRAAEAVSEGGGSQ